MINVRGTVPRVPAHNHSERYVVREWKGEAVVCRIMARSCSVQRQNVSLQPPVSVPGQVWITETPTLGGDVRDKFCIK